jgi:hypothetical protein
MGNGIVIPERIDKDTFYKLCDKKYGPETFFAYAVTDLPPSTIVALKTKKTEEDRLEFLGLLNRDHSKDDEYNTMPDEISSSYYIVKSKLIELFNKNDIYLSHEWGIDSRGRRTHGRVVELHHYLVNKGLIPWLDEVEDKKINNHRSKVSIEDRIVHGIRNTNCILFFITENFIRKVGKYSDLDNDRYEPSDDTCVLEFLTSLKERDTNIMIPVVMEDTVMSTSTWGNGLLAKKLGCRLRVNLCDFENDKFQLDNLSLVISKIAAPLRTGGKNLVAANNDFSYSIVGRYYNWFRDNTSFDHNRSITYANILGDQYDRVGSIVKLFQHLEINPNYMKTLISNIPDEDSVEIYNSLRNYLEFNINLRQQCTIDNTLKIKALKEQEVLNTIFEETKKFEEYNNQLLESDDMRKEESHSKQNILHEKLNTMKNKSDEYERNKMQRQQEHLDELNSQQAMAFEDFLIKSERERYTKRIKDMMTMGKVSDSLHASKFFREVLDRARKFATPKGDSTSLTNSQKLALYEILEEAMYAFNIIVRMLTINPTLQSSISDSGLLPSLSDLYYYCYKYTDRFDPFVESIDPSLNSAIEQGLLAVRLLCRPTLNVMTSSALNIYLLGNVGIINSIIDTIFIHQNKQPIIALAVQCVSALAGGDHPDPYIGTEENNNRNMLREANALEAVSRSISRYIHNLEITEWAFDALNALYTADLIDQDHEGSKTMMRSILHAISTNLENTPRICEYGNILLSQFLNSTPSSREFLGNYGREVGACQNVITTLNFHKDDKGITEAALITFANLAAFNKKTKIKFFKLNGTKVVIDALSMHQSDYFVLASGFCALRNLIHVSDEILFIKHILPDVIQDKHEFIPCCTKEAFNQNYKYDETGNLQEQIKLGAIEHMAKAASDITFKDSLGFDELICVDMCANMLNLLAAILAHGDDSISERVIVNQFCERTCDIMDKYIHVYDIFYKGCMVICELAATNPAFNAIDRLNRNGVCEIIIAGMKLYSSYAAIFNSACRAVLILSLKDSEIMPLFKELDIEHILIDPKRIMKKLVPPVIDGGRITVGIRKRIQEPNMICIVDNSYTYTDILRFQLLKLYNLH